MVDDALARLLRDVRETAELMNALAKDVLTSRPVDGSEEPVPIDAAKLDAYATAVTDHRTAVELLMSYLRHRQE